MAAKKRKKNPVQAPAGALVQPLPRHEPAAPRRWSDWPTVALHAAFFPALFLVSSSSVSALALPKLLVLFAGTLALSLAALVRLRNSGVIAIDRSVLFMTLALAAWWSASTPFALHVGTALNGEYGRYNGLWTHLCCLALFAAAAALPTSAATVKKILVLLVAAIAAVGAVNLAGALGAGTPAGEAGTLEDRVTASALMNFAIPFVAIAAIRARGWARAAWADLLALLIASELVSQGRAAWIGLVVAMAIVAAGLTGGARWKLSAYLLGGTLAIGALTIQLYPAISERLATLASVGKDESLNQRFMYYRAALRAIADHPAAGIGFENFRNAYATYRGAEDARFFDNVVPTMVHNGYIQTALDNGIPALLLYLALLGAVLARLALRLKQEQDSRRRDLLLALLAALAAYLVQDLSGWLNIALVPVFWIVLGLASNQAGEGHPRAGGRATALLAMGFAGIMAVVSLYGLIDGYQRFRADSALFKARQSDVLTQWPETEALLRQALSLLPADSRTELSAGQITAHRFLATRDPAAYARSRELFESCYVHNPFDRWPLFTIIRLDTFALEAGLIDKPSAFSQRALTDLAATDRDNPNFQALRAKFLAVAAPMIPKSGP